MAPSPCDKAGDSSLNLRDETLGRRQELSAHNACLSTLRVHVTPAPRVYRVDTPADDFSIDSHARLWRGLRITHLVEEPTEDTPVTLPQPWPQPWPCAS
eukprot:6225174-Prymnesium_polylepis.1